MGGQEFLEWLGLSDLFVIPLDDEHRWFRYHHLFQQLLQRRLKRRFSPDDIDVLHKHASSWFAENGLIEEALYHALEGGDTAGAVQLVAQNRHDLMNKEQWARLERWLGMLPASRVETDPEMLILKSLALRKSRPNGGNHSASKTARAPPRRCTCKEFDSMGEFAGRIRRSEFFPLLS